MDYEAYRARWLKVPGDHAPGRILAFERWRALVDELSRLSTKTDARSSKRRDQLRSALLMPSE
ncbi:MAG: hypothetical protein R2873_01190 [Caldilineaceae bacterium]